MTMKEVFVLVKKYYKNSIIAIIGLIFGYLLEFVEASQKDLLIPFIFVLQIILVNIYWMIYIFFYAIFKLIQKRDKVYYHYIMSLIFSIICYILIFTQTKLHFLIYAT